MGRTMHNITEHKRIKMSVIVLNVQTPLIDKNTCVGYINIAQDNLCEIISSLFTIYLLFNFSSQFFCLMLNSFHFTRKIQVTYENVRLFVRAISVL